MHKLLTGRLFISQEISECIDLFVKDIENKLRQTLETKGRAELAHVVGTILQPALA